MTYRIIYRSYKYGAPVMGCSLFAWDIEKAMQIMYEVRLRTDAHRELWLEPV